MAQHTHDEVGDWQENGLPSEAQLVMLCLDHLRDLRRSYKPKELSQMEGLDANYLSVAIYALSRAFIRPSELSASAKEGNDAFFDRSKAVGTPVVVKKDTSDIILPDIGTINQEIIYNLNPTQKRADSLSVNLQDPEGENSHVIETYEYNDMHCSNMHRFYLLNGLASGPNLKGPLSLAEIAAAGLVGLGARSRLEAEQEMIKSDLFEQFVEAVRSKGFFSDPANEGPSETPIEAELKKQRAAEIQKERYRKVVAKFRQKLATKAQQAFVAGDTDSVTTRDPVAFAAAEQIRQRREERREELSYADSSRYQDDSTLSQNTETDSKASPIKSLTEKMMPVSPENNPQNQVDLDEAARLKSVGNTHMQNKEYEQAIASYTAALKLSPAGSQSHIYYSNRAAALLSMKHFEEAVLDSERSLALKSDYGKAHSRLGLAHFLLGNYRRAIEAYTVSLKYEPDNQSSKNYLEKAKKRYASTQHENNDDEIPSSFSLASEFEKSATRTKEGKNESLSKQDEAEKFKEMGNSYMSSRQYQKALDAYSEAIRLCDDGPYSHVYFSNRAAALCYLERYQEAENDSQISLELKPNYTKAYSRLGLSRFFMGDYEGAISAYTTALEYDPDNTASRSYLEKAKDRLSRSKIQEESSANIDESFSSPST